MVVTTKMMTTVKAAATTTMVITTMVTPMVTTTEDAHADEDGDDGTWCTSAVVEEASARNDVGALGSGTSTVADILRFMVRKGGAREGGRKQRKKGGNLRKEGGSKGRKERKATLIPSFLPFLHDNISGVAVGFEKMVGGRGGGLSF
jgi:hypothetical protein